MTGTDVIRRTLKARNRARLARDIGVSSDQLERFVEGKAQLSPQVLCQLASELFGGHAEYDPEFDRLRSANKSEPLPMGTPPPIDLDKLDVWGPWKTSGIVMPEAKPKTKHPWWE